MTVDEIDTAAQQAVRAAGAGRRQRLPRARAAAGRRRRATRDSRSTSTSTGSSTTSAPTSRCSARLDVLVFTAGVGREQRRAPRGRRRRARAGSGIAVDRGPQRAPGPSEARVISPDGSPVAVARGADQRGARHRPADRRPRRLTAPPARRIAVIVGTSVGCRAHLDGRWASRYSRREVGRRPVSRSTSSLTPSSSPARTASVGRDPGVHLPVGGSVDRAGRVRLLDRLVVEAHLTARDLGDPLRPSR